METVVSRDGTKIRFETRGSGTPLVLIHGAAGDRMRWAPILPRLAERFTVCLVDRRGRGASGDGATYALEREFEDVAAVADSFDAPVNLLGHSFGGLCALEASLLTGNLGRLVLHEPAVANAADTRPEVLEAMEEQLGAGDPEGVVVTLMRDVVGMSADDVSTFRAQPAFRNRVAAAHTIPRELRACSMYRFQPERFAAMGVPTLVLLGSDSMPFDAEAAFQVHRALPNSRLVLMQGVEHVAIYRDPDQVVDGVTEFLTEPERAPAVGGSP